MLNRLGYFSLNFYKNYTSIPSIKQSSKLFSNFLISIFKYFYNIVIFTKRAAVVGRLSPRKINLF